MTRRTSNASRRAPRWAAAIVLLACAAGAAHAGRLTLVATNFGEPLADPSLARFYVYPLEEREIYAAWGHAARSARVADGEYDVVVRYENGTIEQERVFEGVAIEGDTELAVDFEIAVASLTVDVASGGEPVAPFSGRVSVHRAGRRGTPLAAVRPGERVILAPGQYDVEVAVRDSRGLQARWLLDVAVDGDVLQTVDVGVAPARVTMTVLEKGFALRPGRASWRVTKSGDTRVVAERGSGETLEIPPGRYDVAVLVGGEPVRWLRDLEFRGEQRREVEVAVPAATLRVAALHDGRPLDGAWFEVYPAGDRDTLLRAAPAGSAVEIEPGSYDVRVRYRDGAVRAETTLPAQQVRDDASLQAELDWRPATLRIAPPPGERRRAAAVRDNVLLIVDSSSGMRGLVDGINSLVALRRAAAGALATAPDDLRVAVRAYGIAPAAQSGCTDTTLLAGPAALDTAALDRTLGLLRPSGAAPIALSLERAREDLPAGDVNSVVLVTSGVDACSGDPCRAAAELLRSGAVGRIDVIGLGLDAAARRALGCAGTLREPTSVAGIETALGGALERAGEGGSVSIFEPGWREWIASASLDERVPIAAGVYDLLIHVGSSTYTWSGVRITDRFEAVAGPR